jgi:tRNA A37 threonylcarbamoyladenosine dehydratase
VRSGVGNIVLIDLDDICISNTNRQLHAMSSTVGKMKIEEMKRRLVDINPGCNVTLIHDFVSLFMTRYA